MDYQLKTSLMEYFQKIVAPTKEEERIMQELQSSFEYFPIARVSRADLDGLGFDTKDVTDAKMNRIASGMGSAYLSNGYWIDLEIVAENNDVPRMGDIETDNEEE